MTFDREALEYLGRKDLVGSVVEVNDREYVVNGEGQPIAVPRYEDPLAEPVMLTTLSALVRYLEQNIDELDLARVQVVVETPFSVEVQGWLGDYNRKRDTFARATAQLPGLLNVRQLDDAQSLHDFRINLMTCFAPTPERNALIDALRLVKKNAAVENEDDGLHQRVVVKAGVDLQAESPLPNPVTLAPYRSFLEVDQVPSEFLLRMDGGNGAAIHARLILVDGGAWKIAAREKVGQHLQRLLRESGGDPKIVLW